MRLLEELVISPGAVINGTRMSIREFYFGDMYHFSYNNPNAYKVCRHRPLVPACQPSAEKRFC